MRAFLKLALLALILAPVTACEQEHDEGPASGATCPENSSLTWDSFGKGFMEKYCTRCHASSLSGAARQGAPSDHNFESTELVRMQSEHIDGEAAAGPDSVNTSMPIGSPTPTEDERKQLGEWLACGAP